MPAANTLRLDDGFSTLITLANLPTVHLYEKEVTPPGFDLGGPIDTTTMRNANWRTSAARQLKTLTQVQATVAYATDALEDILAQLGVSQLVTVTFPDGSSLEFYGWIEQFTPSAHKEGEQPTAAITIHPSNRDALGAESAPVYNDPATSS